MEQLSLFDPQYPPSPLLGQSVRIHTPNYPDDSHAPPGVVALSPLHGSTGTIVATSNDSHSPNFLSYEIQLESGRSIWAWRREFIPIPNRD